jgi:GTP-binding protein
MNTLLHFQHQIHFRAEDGISGGPNGRRGARGQDLIIPVPLGTVVRDLQSGEVIADLTKEGEEVVVAQGGRGGRGNRTFTSSTRQAPRIREWGEPGEERWLELELRLLADVGIVGLPNVGKSSLLGAISRGRPKVAAYPFTTLVPNLGVVRDSLVVADLPGLVEGAHEGKGLGDRFLRHAARTKLLLHLVDLAGPMPLGAYRALRRELSAREELRGKPELVAGNKADLLTSKQVAQEVARFRAEGVELHPISALTGQGVGELLERLFENLERLPPQVPLEQAGSLPYGKPERQVWRLTPQGRAFTVVEEGEVLVVRGGEVEQLVRRLDLSTRDARDYLWEELGRMGVMGALRRRGLTPGGRVRIGEVEVEFAG